MAWGETAYHLDQLVKSSDLFRDKSGHRDYYFPAGYSPGDRLLVRALQSPAGRALLVELATKPGQSFMDLAGSTSMGRSTLAFHLRYLLKDGLVEAQEQNGKKCYRTNRPDLVLRLHREYRESWGSRWVDRFTDAFGGIMRE